ncbi:hypothetical protein T484DRAFT_1830759 [Baffinella frigidus]|nr:hypothetical protein T484DRAFT_1830759 [Cryptophyta sp. CCMP2293]
MSGETAWRDSPVKEQRKQRIALLEARLRESREQRSRILGDSGEAEDLNGEGDGDAGWVAFGEEEDGGAGEKGTDERAAPPGGGSMEAVWRLAEQLKDAQVQLNDSRRVQSSLREMAERSQRLAESLETCDLEREREFSALRADLEESRDRADQLASSVDEANDMREEMEDLQASLANALAEKRDSETRLALSRGVEEGLEKGLREAREALSQERQRHARAWAAAAADRQDEAERAAQEDARLREAGGWEVKGDSVDEGVQVDAEFLSQVFLEDKASFSHANAAEEEQEDEDEVPNP